MKHNCMTKEKAVNITDGKAFEPRLQATYTFMMISNVEEKVE